MVSSCGANVKENCTYFRNPGFPTSINDVQSCQFTIQKIDKSNFTENSLKNWFWKTVYFSDVCTIRLDFEAFSIVGPADTIETMGGKCTDTFQATSVSLNISILWRFMLQYFDTFYYWFFF